VGFVQSPYLTQHVNPARTDFDDGLAEDADAEQATLTLEEDRRLGAMCRDTGSKV
jgi:hypothetical protein